MKRLENILNYLSDLKPTGKTGFSRKGKITEDQGRAAKELALVL